jgi:hypothetical protein
MRQRYHKSAIEVWQSADGFKTASAQTAIRCEWLESVATENDNPAAEG